MEPLKAILDTLDNVDEALHGLYERKEDDKTKSVKYVLRLDPNSVREHPSVLPLTNALTRTKDELRETKDKLTGANQRLENVPEDFDGSLYSRLKAEDEARKANPDQADRQLESQRSMYEERIAKATETARKQLGERDALNVDLQNRLDTRDKDQSLDQALAVVGIKREFLPAVRALLRPKVQIDHNEEIDGRPLTFIDTDMGRQTVQQFMQNWVQTDAGKIYVEQASGGDAGGGRGTGAPMSHDNPWRSDGGRKPNLTRQQTIMKENPALARRLAGQAGVSLNI